MCFLWIAFCVQYSQIMPDSFVVFVKSQAVLIAADGQISQLSDRLRLILFLILTIRYFKAGIRQQMDSLLEITIQLECLLQIRNCGLVLPQINEHDCPVIV